MKKFLFYILCIAMLLCLTACGSEPEPEMSELAPVETVSPAAEAEAASAADAAALEVEPAASATDAEVDEAALAAAEACVGMQLEELYAAVGEPDDASYAASCLEENAEDGMLFYNDQGFYVWTVRGESGEVVHAVYPLD